MKCTNCSKEFEENLKYCPWCGMAVSSMKKAASSESNFALGTVSAAKAQEKDLIQKPVNRETLIPDYAPVPVNDGGSRKVTGNEEKEDTSKTVTIPREYREKTIDHRYDDTYTREERSSISYDRPKERKPKGNSSEFKPLIITLICVIVLSVTFLVLYLGTDIFARTANCGVCATEIDKSEQFCEICSEKYKCDGCGNIDATVEAGFCEACFNTNVCKGCREFFDVLDEGFCDGCIDEYTCRECGAVSEDVVENYCKKCVKKYTCKACDAIDESVKKGYCFECRETLTCKDCERISENTIEGYCEKCILNHTCQNCEAIAEVIKNGYCEECIKNHICIICGEFKDQLANGYCDDCHDDYNCKTCGKIDLSTKADGICDDCKNKVNAKNIKCSSCSRETSKEKAYKSQNGKYYCSSCVTGYYCTKCKAPVSSGRKLCVDCA